MDHDLRTSIDEVKDREKLDRDRRICQQTFEVVLGAYVPELADAQGARRKTPENDTYCHSSWRDGATPSRQELIELSQRWAELGLPGSCPCQPSVEELAEHAKQWEDFETVQKFKVFLMRVLDVGSEGRVPSEGWVLNEGWEAAKAAHKQLYEQWMETVRVSEDPEMNEERGREAVALGRTIRDQGQ
ncbi:hypothetical protein CLCR_00333 [Cladophialophora carrionii]|uniref:Uncharacterized protein n=1 Tax=Cladophialophora carrionii TaxID=86049 RepID=A0A1C1D085_9EURO|nr:hypothetical protein CLCR_00333 [Cladophialophora carrionii]